MAFCIGCGTEITKGSNFCPSCGADQSGQIRPIVQSQRPSCGLICRSCGSSGDARVETRGTFAVELLLWGLGVLGLISVIGVLFGLLFLACAFAYSIWRLGGRTKVCRSCGGPMISADSPVGQKLLG